MYTKILQHVSRYIDLTPQEKEEFTGILIERKISKKQFLFQPGDKVVEEFYVVKGCLKAYYLDEMSNKHILQFAVEDWWISDFEAFFNDLPAQLHIECLEDSVLLGIHKDSLDTLYERIPQFERFFRLKITNAFVSLRSRILSSLQKNGKQRYIEFCEAYPNLEQRVANYHIANYLGIKPESLSRIRKELVRT